jgi:hypothetical protein
VPTSINSVCNASQPFLAYAFILYNLLHSTNIVSLSIIEAPHTIHSSNWTIHASIIQSISSFNAKRHDLITCSNPQFLFCPNQNDAMFQASPPPLVVHLLANGRSIARKISHNMVIPLSSQVVTLFYRVRLGSIS